VLLAAFVEATRLAVAVFKLDSDNDDDAGAASALGLADEVCMSSGAERLTEPGTAPWSVPLPPVSSMLGQPDAAAADEVLSRSFNALIASSLDTVHSTTNIKHSNSINILLSGLRNSVCHLIGHCELQQWWWWWWCCCIQPSSAFTAAADNDSSKNTVHCNDCFLQC